MYSRIAPGTKLAQGQHVRVVRGGRLEEVQRPCEEVRRPAGGAPGSEAGKQGAFLEGFDFLLQIRACQNAGVGGLELIGDGGAATWHVWNQNFK
jgi:hypothetical protein